MVTPKPHQDFLSSGQKDKETNFSSDSEPSCGQQRTRRFAKAPFSSWDTNSPIGAREFYRFGYTSVSEIWLVSGGKLQVSRAEIQEGETGQ